VSKLFIRDLDAVATPAVSTRYLVSRSVFRQSLPLKISKIALPHPTPAQGDPTAEVMALLLDWHHERLFNKTQYDKLRSLVRDDSPACGKMKLINHCHCEAGIMAMLLATRKSKRESLGSEVRSSRF
jgi:hypothetical protein